MTSVRFRHFRAAFETPPPVYVKPSIFLPQAWPSHEAEMSAHPGAAASCSFKIRTPAEPAPAGEKLGGPEQAKRPAASRP